MEVFLDYYKLVADKRLGDGKTIPHSQELILIKEDTDEMMFFETYNDDYKKLFWAEKGEVEFVRSSTEDWEDEEVEKRNRYINGEFL